MEILDKENATAEARVAELQASLANLMQQEETLRMQQASITEHLRSGCKPESNVEAEAQGQAQAPDSEQAPPADVL